MVFSSLLFMVLFLPISIIGYYVLNPKIKNYFLLAVSVFFYFWGEPEFILVVFISIFANYLFGLGVDRFKNKFQGKLFLILSLIWNLGIIFIYKYLDFTITNINGIFNLNIPLQKITLPIGISFFTFQAISYVIDVYRGNGTVQKNPFNVALFLLMFPQLIAGPIVRYQTVANEIDNRKENIEDFYSGMKRFIVGLGKKVILSNLVAVVAEKAFYSTAVSSLTVSLAWIGAIAYSLQIYFDFSGYSDMAIGLGRIFGFHFNENFDYPYCSKNVSEFWRRWHISLGSWFRDYVYFPLGGSRVNSKVRLVFNLTVVWVLTGVWHGASWNFILWGVLYLVVLVFEKLTGIAKGIKNIFVANLYRVFTLLCVLIGWVLFNSPSLNAAGDYLLVMFGISGNPIISDLDSYFIGQYIFIIIISAILSVPIIPIIKNKLFSLKHSAIFKLGENIVLIFVLLICMSFIAGNTYNPFIYFNF